MPFEIVDNTIDTHGATSMGIAMLADGGRAVGNTVTMAGEQSVAMLVAGSNAEVARNVIRGRRLAGVSVVLSEPLAARGNRLADNDLGGFAGTRGQLVLGKGTSGTVCSGRLPDRVVDEGEANRCR